MNPEPEVLKFYERHPVQKQTVGESLTKQSFHDETEINNIMRRYRETGIIEHVKKYQGRYGEFDTVPDYQTALNRLHEAQEMFMSLPADIRKRFQNDPGEFLAFATDPKNADELIEMGLAERPAPDLVDSITGEVVKRISSDGEPSTSPGIGDPADTASQ